mgnify:CR=1 FL=1
MHDSYYRIRSRRQASLDDEGGILGCHCYYPGLSGALAINMSSLLGYKLAKTPGAIVCTFGAFVAIVSYYPGDSMFFHQFEDNKVVAALFAGIRPAVVALIAVPTLSLAKSARISLVNCWIPILSALLIWLLGVNPIWVIIAAAVGGYIYGQFIQPTE